MVTIGYVYGYASITFIMQATLTDRLVGLLMIFVASGVFMYYSLWVIVLVREDRARCW